MAQEILLPQKVKNKKLKVKVFALGKQISLYRYHFILKQFFFFNTESYAIQR